MEDFGAPFVCILFVFREQLGGKFVQVATGVVKVEGSLGALLEAILEDIPQPYAPVHYDINSGGFAEAHAVCLVLNLLAKGERISFCGGGNDMLGDKGPTLWTQFGLILEPVDDRRLDFVPVDSFLAIYLPLFPPVFATVSGQPSVHHDDEHIFRGGLIGTRS